MDTPTALARWPQLGRTLEADCRVFRIWRERVQPRPNRPPADFFSIECFHWVVALAQTTDDRWLLVRQYRVGVHDFTWELPAGCLEAGEDPVVAAQRELREETGGIAGRAELLGWAHPNPALQHNRCWFVWCRDVVLGGAVSPDEHEQIEVAAVPIERLRGALRTGEISHALAVAAFWHLEQRLRS